MMENVKKYSYLTITPPLKLKEIGLQGPMLVLLNEGIGHLSGLTNHYCNCLTSTRLGSAHCQKCVVHKCMYCTVLA